MNAAQLWNKFLEKTILMMPIMKPGPLAAIQTNSLNWCLREEKPPPHL